ncbi:unnamed protein product [Hyaloperonospora brassicae]|uniref:FYVE-type domain-containing protein n=1 Tax=Hyaloperonospora brassicae TaxID=162125 RepID=A0AAV0UIW5_HYABA|nr:unnamed protein product [Hyaloperonospora brassicae]
MASRPRREFLCSDPPPPRGLFAHSHSHHSLSSSYSSHSTASLSSSSSSSRTPHARSYFSSSGGPHRSPLESSAASSSSTADGRQEDDHALVALATAACARVEHARATFASSAGWKARSEGAGVRVFERRGATFDVAASTALPCSATEVLELLSSRNSDDFNASMVALAGDAFAHAVTLREVPTPASPDVHLSVKRVTFAGALPLVCRAKTVELLDFVQVDRRARTAIRTFHTLARDADGRRGRAGDVLAGYVLTEQTALHQTAVFYYGSCALAATTPGKGLRKAATAQALLKLARAIPKMGEISVRRRLGAADTADAADDVADGSCAGCGQLVKGSLLRKKKHVCYICSHHVCGSCAKAQDVETLIGVIERARVCCMCIAAARHRAFETLEQLQDRPVYLLRPSAMSDLSATSTAVDSTASYARVAVAASARG